MSEAKKCDRCGKLYENYRGVELNNIGYKYHYVRLCGNGVFTELDLCEPCMTELANWLREGGEKK